MVSGIPNMFTVTGPQSPSVLSNMFVSIEQHVDWISNCIEHMVTNNVESIEASAHAENDWVNHARQVSEYTLYPLSNSWYLGAKVSGKPRVVLPYLGGIGNYRKLTTEIAQDGYRGFTLQSGKPVADAGSLTVPCRRARSNASRQSPRGKDGPLPRSVASSERGWPRPHRD
jgi:cyclohexanone monooxygenase